MIYSGRYDARQDLGSLLGALRELAEAGRPAGLATDEPWPPRLLFAGASPDDRAALARAAAREGVGRCRRLCAAAGRRAGSRRSSAVPGPRCCRSCRTAPACPRSRRSPAGCRSWRRRSGRCRRSSGAAGILVEPRDARPAGVGARDRVRRRARARDARRGGPGAGDERGSDVGRRRPGDARGLRHRDRAPLGERQRLTHPAGIAGRRSSPGPGRQRLPTSRAGRCRVRWRRRRAGRDRDLACPSAGPGRTSGRR